MHLKWNVLMDDNTRKTIEGLAFWLVVTCFIVLIGTGGLKSCDETPGSLAVVKDDSCLVSILVEVNVRNYPDYIVFKQFHNEQAKLLRKGDPVIIIAEDSTELVGVVHNTPYIE